MPLQPNYLDEFDFEEGYYELLEIEAEECDFCSFSNCDCNPNACCYEPGYIGAQDSCHCQAYHEEMEKANKWHRRVLGFFQERYNRAYYWATWKMRRLKPLFGFFKPPPPSKKGLNDDDELPF